MDFIRLSNAADERYDAAMALYAISFPLHERRLPASQLAALQCPDYHFDLIYQQEQFSGLMLYWETADWIYVEHFCMLPTIRGQGGGSRALAKLAETGKPILLEIDPPEDDISRRRRGFYLRAGFCENPYPHVHPAYRKEFSGHALVVLSHSAPLSQADYDAFATYLQTVVMAQ